MIDDKSLNNIISISNADLEQILCITVNLPKDEIRPQFQVVLCKHLLYSEPGLLGFPLKGQIKSFLICLSKKYFNTKKIQNRLAKNTLTIEKVEQASPESFLNCMNFSIFTKLSPQFNAVAEYYVDGENFLWFESRLSAFTADFYIVPNRVDIHLKTYSISLPVLRIDQLNVPSGHLIPYQNNPMVDFIPQEFIGNKRCLVLPSLKKGNIVSIHKRFPPNDCFPNYHSLKLFWKNVYGYKLPENEKAIFFINISFGFSKSFFLYPSCCIRYSEPIILKRQNLHIIENLYNLLRESFPSICGFSVSHKLSQSTFIAKLANSSEQQKDSEVNKKITVSKAILTVSNVKQLNNDVKKILPKHPSQPLNINPHLEVGPIKCIDSTNTTTNTLKAIQENNIIKLQTTENKMPVTHTGKIIPKFNKIRPRVINNVKNPEKDNCKNTFEIKNEQFNQFSNTQNGLSPHTTMGLSQKAKPNFYSKNFIKKHEKKCESKNTKPTPKTVFQVALPAEIERIDFIGKDLSTKTSVTSKISKPVAVKREGEKVEKGPKEKKKKEVVIPSNIETLIVGSGSVSKDVLLMWLKEKGVKCKVKEKKEELMTKAQEFMKTLQ